MSSLTLEELVAKFDGVWLRGYGWRQEVGEVLYQIKEKADHGQWGAFLKDKELPRSTADDYIRQYKVAADIAETRQFEEPNPESEPDAEADEREEDIAAEQKKRVGKTREHNPTEVRVKLKDLRPDQTSDYWDARKADAERVDFIWHQAFLTIIRAHEEGTVYPPPLEAARV